MRQPAIREESLTLIAAFFAGVRPGAVEATAAEWSDTRDPASAAQQGSDGTDGFVRVNSTS